MILILIGPPGSGKGTQAKFISDRFNIPHISTGDMFRQAMRDGTELGKKANEYMEHGNLVPDDVTVALVEDRIRCEDCNAGFLLDGFPRTIPQASALDKMLERNNRVLTKVILFTVSDDILVKRLSGRRTCRSCGKISHVSQGINNKLDKCPACGQEVFQRDDDKPEAIINRLAVYKKSTEPLIDYYKRKVLEILADGPIDEIKTRMAEDLENIG